MRRLKEVQGELSHETSLRESLEESHNTLLQRVQEMESVVEGEREEVGWFSYKILFKYVNLVGLIHIGVLSY